MIIIFVFATRQILHSSYCLCKYFCMLILCNIFVELEHFILYNNFYTCKYHNFIY